MEFVSFEIAKKLKEKGFSCKYPLAMYNERGWFCPLYTSADHNPNIKSVFGNREYYDYDDFDEKDFIAPTISQVLKWLRKEKQLHVSIMLFMFAKGWCYEIIRIGDKHSLLTTQRNACNTYEEAARAGIKYVLDNLI